MEPPAPPPPAADALSSLPDAVVDGSILTRLDLRDVVRTSALSRAWRHRWESLPTLSLSLRDGIGTPPSIVDSVLSRYAGRIPDFSIRINSQSACRVDDWLIDLSLRDVQSMDLRSNDCLLSIRSSIYSFSHLVTLKLHRCDIPTRPVGFAGFPLLKDLELVDAHLSEIEDLEAIVRGSPLLDALMVSDAYILNKELAGCVIEAPNLRSLTIISVVVYGWQFGGLPRLDNATIDLDTYMYEGDLGEFLAGVAHARKLTLTTFYLPKMGDDTLLETLPYKFFNLRSLFLCTHFCGLYSILATFCLLRNAPSLEELEITINGDQEQETEANTEFQNTQWTNGIVIKDLPKPSGAKDKGKAKEDEEEDDNDKFQNPSNTVNCRRLPPHKSAHDGGSGLNVLFAKTLRKMGLDVTHMLTSMNSPFYGIISGNAAVLLGHVVLPVTFGTKDHYQTEYIWFEVAVTSYHAILGRLALAKVMAIPHYVYLVLKMLGPKGVLSLRGDLKKSYDCDTEAVELASTTQMPNSMLQVFTASK
ncbi:F-box/FBD/LRR-repeat protein At1g13570 [Setaria viridis]|uniref:F-box/FBD/LRR-repeat protein At1g13570 n=1 Tax=Setaria viridis TaxID=4556 RepID=UPI003B3B63E4